jgi:hypothetical protein
MRSTVVLILLALLFGISPLFGQAVSCQLHFIPVYGNSGIIQIDSSYKYLDQASIQFETFKCYVSQFELLDNGKVVWSEPDSYHLLNLEAPSSLSIPLLLPKTLQFDGIQFNIGIDSAANTAGAMGGDLDPTKGMYWTWQNGYINFKLEGTCSAIATPKHQFQYHLGGYLQGMQTVQQVQLKVQKSTQLTIAIDLKKFVDSLDFAQQPMLMAPGQRAVVLSRQLRALFQAK